MYIGLNIIIATHAMCSSYGYCYRKSSRLHYGGRIVNGTMFDKIYLQLQSDTMQPEPVLF